MVDHSDLVVVGRICGVYGVAGWVKVYSYTDQQMQILKYKPWFLHQGDRYHEVVMLEGRKHAKGIIAHLKGIDDRDQAAELVNAEIAINSDQLPKLPKGEYYWADLKGLIVETESGDVLGEVTDIFQTGANDVLVVKPEKNKEQDSEDILIPYIEEQVIKLVDLEQNKMIVDWDPDY